MTKLSIVLQDLFLEVTEGCIDFNEVKEKIQQQIKKIKEEENKLWFSFKETPPKIGQYIKIWWSTDEVTEQVWQNDIVWCGRELPRFWKPLKNL